MQTKKDQQTGKNPNDQAFQRPEDAEQQKKNAANQHLTDDLEGKEDEGIEDEEGIEEDGAPVLDEEDLEENDLTDDEADNIEWDSEKNPKKP